MHEHQWKTVSRRELFTLMEIAKGLENPPPLNPLPPGKGETRFPSEIPFRELSLRVTGDSKGLYSIRPYLHDMLGGLKEIGIIEHSPLFFCSIPLIGEVNGRSIDLSVAADYTVITESTASEFKPLHGNFKSLLLIENQTTFELAVNQLPKDMGCIFLSGYPPGHVQGFVKNTLSFNPVPGYIWCDIDPDGIEIALKVGQWFEETGQRWQPLGMDRETLSGAAITKPLNERDREKLKLLKTRPEAKVFHALVEEMEKAGRKMEQEAVNLVVPTGFEPVLPE